MKKIVINACHGGFSLSWKAVARYAELKGEQCFLFDAISFRTPREKWKLVSVYAAKGNYIRALRVPDPSLLPDLSAWQQMSTQERVESNKKHDEMRWDNRAFNRDDELLVRVIEELGDAANGDCAELKIVEIPDDVEWKIEEYDGLEWVAEKHRTWG